MDANDEPRDVSISARLPQGEEPGFVTVQLTGRDLRLIATGQGQEGKPAAAGLRHGVAASPAKTGKSRLKALQSVVGELQAGIDRLRRQEGAKGGGSERRGDTRILLGRSAIPDPQKLGNREPVTRYAIPLSEDEIMATAALEFFDDARRSVVVGFVLPGSGETAGTHTSLRWGLRDEILRELYDHLKKRFGR